MTTATTRREMSPAPIQEEMTHRTPESAATSIYGRAWMAWCNARGIACEVQERIYYNRPASRVNESMDADETTTDVFWEVRYDRAAANIPVGDLSNSIHHHIHLALVAPTIRYDNPQSVAYDDSTLVRLVQAAIDEREKMNAEGIATRAAKVSQLRSMLADKSLMGIVRQKRLGTAMLDDLRNDPRTKELAEGVNRFLISLDDIRAAL